MPAFEYKIVTSADTEDDDETMLNEYGEDGWELVGVTSSEMTFVESEGDDGTSGDEGEEFVDTVFSYYLKRQKA
jgi:hypothetical protein